MERVTAAVVLYNNAELIPGLSATIQGLSPAGAVIYDSCSSDGSAEKACKMISDAAVITGDNLGFGNGCNRCLEKIDTEYTLFLNSDASITRENLALLVAALDENSCLAAVQPVIRLWGWELVTAGRGVYLTPFGESWDAGFMHLEPFIKGGIREVPAVTAAVALWRTSVLKKLGGFDTGYFMYFEDADLSLRARGAGWKVALCGGSQAAHMVGASAVREKAELWELASSIRLQRRFLRGSGLSERSLWSRELRIAAGMLLRGISPFARIKTFLKALAAPAPEEIALDRHTKSILYGIPGDMPLRRPEQGAPGPGWQRGRAAPWAGLKPHRKPLKLALTGESHASTAAVVSGSGELLRRVTVSPSKTVEVTLAEPPGIVYIKCDSLSDSIKVEVK